MHEKVGKVGQYKVCVKSVVTEVETWIGTVNCTPELSLQQET